MPATRILTALLTILLVATLATAQNREDRRDRRDRGDRAGERGDRGDRAGRRERGGGARGGNARVLSTPEYHRRDLPIFVDELGLDQTQKVIVETLLMDYHGTVEAAYAGVRTQLEALRPERTPEEEAERRTQREQMGQLRSEMRQIRNQIENADPGDAGGFEQQLADLETRMEESRSAMFNREEANARAEAQAAINDEWAARRKAMGVEFMGSVQATLNDDQLLRWPTFERNLRRVKTMRLGRLSGESVDLFVLIRQMAVAVETVPELSETLEAYAYELDSALVARNRHLEEHRQGAARATRAGDLDLAEAITSTESDLRRRVRDVNEEHAVTIATVLDPEAEGATFQQEFRTRAYPRIFRPTRMQRAFEAARELEGLTIEVMLGVTTLEEAYLVDLGFANEKIHGTTLREEPKEQVGRIKRMAERLAEGGGGRGFRDRGERRRGRGQGEDGEMDPIRQAFFEREELDYRYWQQLVAILTPEQIAQLPEVREPGQRGRRGERGGGMRERLAQADTNGDGKLQKSEAPERMQRFFDRLDANGDGELDESEMENMGNRRRGNRGGRGRDRGGDA